MLNMTTSFCVVCIHYSTSIAFSLFFSFIYIFLIITYVWGQNSRGIEGKRMKSLPPSCVPSYLAAISRVNWYHISFKRQLTNMGVHTYKWSPPLHGSLPCCSPRGRQESDTTGQLNSKKRQLPHILRYLAFFTKQHILQFIPCCLYSLKIAWDLSSPKLLQHVADHNLTLPSPPHTCQLHQHLSSPDSLPFSQPPFIFSCLSRHHCV